MALIACEDLSCGYEGHAVLRDVCFSVQEGDYLVIFGENGSGKTTLMRTVLGLQKPLGGRIITGGGLKRNELGYLPQQTSIQRDFPASVREIVLSGFGGSLGWRPFYGGKEKRAAFEIMAKLGITALEKRCYRELSGGQQQRVLLARALCAAKKAVLLDEPVAGLDPQAAQEMYSLIGSLNGEGTAIIMISHDPETVLNYATHVLHIGRTVFFGSKEDYLSKGIGFFAFQREEAR